MKTLLYTIFFSLFGIHLLAQSNKVVCLDGKDNNLRIGMDTLCRHWTLEAWIKPDNNEWKSQEVIIGGGEYSELNSLDYLPLVIDHGRLCNVATGLVGEEIPKGKWTHVAAVCNGRCTLLYINGREVARKDTATVILPGAIGINESSESAFGGCIDEVRIWKTGLTEKELNEWMYRPVTARHSQFDYLKGYYNFDDLSEDISINRAAEGRLSFHLRNGRLEQYKSAPLAYAVENDNPLFRAEYGEQELFKVVALPAEWDVDRGKRDFQLLKLRIETQGEQSPKAVKELVLDFGNCTSLKDIERIHIYNTGSKPRSNVRIELVKGGLVPKSGKIKIRLSENESTRLKHGTNYLLVTVDVNAEAVLGNCLGVNVQSVKIGRRSITPILSDDCLPVMITSDSRNNKKYLKVLQWNIWHGGKHLGNDGRERIIDLIKQSGADVVTMQEGYGSQEMIAKAIGFNLQTPSPRDNLCLFSRYPIQKIKTKNTFYSNPAIITLPSGKKVYVNACWLRYAYRPEYTCYYANYGMDTHRWAAEDSILALVDMKRLLENDLIPYVDSSMPIIIGGDFNSCSHLDWTHKAAPIHFGYIAEELPVSRYMLDKGFRDTFREINPDELERGEGTYAVIFGQSQTSRVDFIYSKGNGIKTVASKIVRTMPEIDDVWPGDHAAVLTVFELE